MQRDGFQKIDEDSGLLWRNLVFDELDNGFQYEKGIGGAFYLLAPDGRIRFRLDIAAGEDISNGVTDELDKEIDSLCREFGIFRSMTF